MEGVVMRKKLFIDYFMDNEDLIKRSKDKKINYQFENILYYCKEKYNLTVVDLATIFNVRRQTIYNYFKNKTEELPNVIKDKLAEIYETKTFHEALGLELGFELYSEQELNLFNSEGISQNLEKNLEYYKYDTGIYNEPIFVISDKYDFELKFHFILNETKTVNENKKYKFNIIDYLNQNTDQYNNELTRNIIKAKPNDVEFLNYITNYFISDKVLTTSKVEDIKIDENISGNARVFLNNYRSNFLFKLSSDLDDQNYLFEELSNKQITSKHLIIIDIILNQKINANRIEEYFKKIKNKEVMKIIPEIINGFVINETLKTSKLNIYVFNNH